ncbi:hypothetical protein [Haloarcula sp. JP-L23]|uniref:hypothetical protein n=1 Tax=Haloarcula sp. JP-L23 TaxID=2716717 RepID=UPI00140EB040|nr:hypothetical protein G9465_24450 [Haloarcula sp. JP-L23]
MTQTDTDPALALSGTFGYDTPEAGTVVFDGRTQAPEAVGLTTHGFATGPVEVSPYHNSTTVVRDLSYGASEGGFFDGWGSDDGDGEDGDDGDDGGFFTSALAAVGLSRTRAKEDDEHEGITRREFAKAAGGLAILGGGLAAQASAQSDTVSIARFDLRNPEGCRFRIRDLGPGYLPTDGLYYVLIGGMDYAETQGGSSGSADLPPDPKNTFREVEIATSADSILAGVKESIGKKTLSYEFDLSTSPAEASAGTQLTLSDHPLLVAATLRSGPSATTLDVGGEAVPHRTEARDKPEGYYYVDAGTLVYQVGPEPPPGTAATFEIYTGSIGETKNDIAQQY